LDGERTLGLIDKLDPGLAVLFRTRPAATPEYEKPIQTANEYLLASVPSENIVDYSVYETAATFGLLESLCSGLCREWRVVLSSTGPKMFAVCCFLVATVRKELSVWRVTPADRIDPIDDVPCGEVVFLETQWT
jgi:hypothetical protein